MALMLLSHPNDNVIATASVVSVDAGSVDPIYPIDNLYNGNPALPCKFTTRQGRIVFDFGSPVSVPFPVIIHHNLTVAARWEANATSVWTSPSMSQAFEIAALDIDGYRTNLHLDVSDASGYGAYRYWSLVVDVDNAANIVLGELWLGGVIRRVVGNIVLGSKRVDDAPGRSSFETRGGVEWVHSSVGRRREIANARFITTYAGLTILRDWNLACGGRDRPTILVPSTPDSDDAWLARWTSDWTCDDTDPVVAIASAGWKELARGPAI
jgi:hypothetical protein